LLKKIVRILYYDRPEYKANYFYST
jgi:hypothetical protein